MVLLVETLKAVFHRVLLCLLSRMIQYLCELQHANEKDYHSTMTLVFEFEPESLYVITHDLPVN